MRATVVRLKISNVGWWGSMALMPVVCLGVPWFVLPRMLGYYPIYTPVLSLLMFVTWAVVMINAARIRRAVFQAVIRRWQRQFHTAVAREVVAQLKGRFSEEHINIFLNCGKHGVFPCMGIGKCSCSEVRLSSAQKTEARNVVATVRDKHLQTQSSRRRKHLTAAI